MSNNIRVGVGVILIMSALLPFAASAAGHGQFSRTLKVGSRGEEVLALQELLASDATIYPERLTTGVFGPKTARAVKRFQKMHNVEQVGLVGPKTRRLLNELLLSLASASTSLSASTTEHTSLLQAGMHADAHKGCPFTPPGHLIAPGWIKHHGKPTVAPCQVLPRGIAKLLGLLTIGTSTTPTSVPTPTPTSTPVVDVTAPTILGLAVTGLSSSTATVSWTTNELATGGMSYGTTSPLVLSSATTVATTTLSIPHLFVLTNLTASTTYYGLVSTHDAANNTATTTVSFTTTN